MFTTCENESSLGLRTLLGGKSACYSSVFCTLCLAISIAGCAGFHTCKA
ncbi:hypothetical protein APHNYW_0924 [Anaplasma phagocytophilum str. ApNYW]|nr:hypothetical protein APHNYW_0924 [Anaplasma phagocytophilum str. ApNYW]